jgi:histidinol phosphatase-like PHP family hydrolase
MLHKFAILYVDRQVLPQTPPTIPDFTTTLVKKAVNRLNRVIRPDSVVVVAPKSEISEIKPLTAKIEMPVEFQEPDSPTPAPVDSLLQSPFPITIVEQNTNGEQKITTHPLKMSEELGLVDCHVHTQFAYCSKNMNIQQNLALAREFGLAQIGLVEHTGQLLFNAETFWPGAFMDQGLDCDHGVDDRFADFANETAALNDFSHVGFEVDSDFLGRPVLPPRLKNTVEYRLGAVHWLPESRDAENPNQETAAHQYLSILETFLPSGINILAHPTRLFQRMPGSAPAWLIDRIVALLKKHDVAAEINFHKQITEPELVLACLDQGVKMTLGSDAHELWEIAEFAQHLELLEHCGVRKNDLQNVLLKPWRG